VTEVTPEDIVELALAIVDDETQAWLAVEPERPQGEEGSPDA
jgi:hypothetical protein